MTIHTLDLGFLDVPEAIAAFALETPNGQLVLVECGPYSTLPHLANALSAKGLQIENVHSVLLSHIHFDHAGAAWALAEKGAKIYVHPVGLPHLQSPERLYNSARQIYGEQMDRLWGEMRPIDPQLLYAPEHGEVIEIGGLKCTAWYTPGHAVHHIAWECTNEDADSAVIFTGDVAGVRIGPDNPVVPPCPPPDIDVEAWQQSIQLLRDRPSNRLFLTHFGEISDKTPHLDALETRLLAWANWMQPYAEQGAASETVVPLFEKYVRDELRAAGVPETQLQQYDAANPAFMSVAGLLRYWRKKSR